MIWDTTGPAEQFINEGGMIEGLIPAGKNCRASTLNGMRNARQLSLLGPPRCGRKDVRLVLQKRIPVVIGNRGVS